jgi:hypothetical protein
MIVNNIYYDILVYRKFIIVPYEARDLRKNLQNTKKKMSRSGIGIIKHLVVSSQLGLLT